MSKDEKFKIEVVVEPILKTYVSDKYELNKGKTIRFEDTRRLQMMKMDLLSGIEQARCVENMLDEQTVISGDESFDQKRYKTFSYSEIKKAYTEALRLDLRKTRNVLEFCKLYGLPLSDCTEHIKRYVGVNYYDYAFAERKVEMVTLNNVSDFCDFESYIKSVYSIKIIQDMASLKKAIDDAREDFYYIQNRDVVSLYIQIVRILLSFSLKLFTHSVRARDIRYNTETASFIAKVTEKTDFGRNDLSCEELYRRLIDLEYEDDNRIYLIPYLNNEHAAFLMKMLCLAIQMAQERDTDVLSLLFGRQKEIKYDDILKCCSSDSQRAMIDRKIVEAGVKVYYDLLSEVNFESYHLAESLNMEGVRYSCYLPSLVHGMFYVQFMEKEGKMKVCRNCGKLYPEASRRKDSKYCSDNCGEYFRNIKSKMGKQN